ncbi:flagellar export chaperone FliS [Candidatus Caldatribacterium sp.]|uniref:flagellar export chaperone FliS n=1 Tax=Candidatus Caldatribacterium sp. TaxID=2282143 RepID=UPI0029983C88|nr:flagellar export chaperone FliS [Candidatus Caldatribacterium sp.]MDW8082131.1 flagellar export chaperone FliS [Candidatus Calescibacterium sp.]
MNAYATMARRFYEENTVNTASPLKLVILLYDGAIKFFKLAKQAFAEGDEMLARMHMAKAERIVLELLGSLNVEEGGEIAANLFALYRFILRECARTNRENAATTLSGVIRILSGLREAWKELESRGQGTS